MTYLSIKNWAADDRPREKLCEKGVQALSDSEILAIIIGTGTRELSAVELARKILSSSENKLSVLAKKSLKELMREKGIGQAKAISIIAAIELGRRYKQSDMGERTKITSSKDVYEYISPVLADLPHEEFWVLFLNRSNKVIDKYKLSQGGIVGTVIDIRLLLKRALDLLACSIILCHNHPSGNLLPSDNDKKITLKIKQSGEQMDIKLLDHIIVADNSYFSFSDESLI